MTPPADTLTRFGPGGGEFARSVFEEHVEDASFLHRHWLYSYENPIFPWEELEWVSTRLERHMGALAGGGDVVLELCRERARQANFGARGELYTAVRVFCGAERFDLFAELAGAEANAAPSPTASGEGSENDSDRENDGEHDTRNEHDKVDYHQREAGVEDALVRAAPAAWITALGELLVEGAEPKMARAVVSAIGRRRMPLGAQVLEAAMGELEDPAPFLWALGRLRVQQGAGPVLLRYAKTGEPGAMRAAFLTAVHLGIPAAIGQLRQAALAESWPAIPLAVLGAPDVLPLLQGMLERGQAEPEVYLALGILGVSDSVHSLLQALGGPLAEPAAAALYLLTGAEVSEDVVIEDAPGQDDGEGAAPADPGSEHGSTREDEAATGGHNGAGETSPPRHKEQQQQELEEPNTIEVRRLSRELEAWESWWAAHAKRFGRGRRYRFGLPRETAEPVEALLPRLRWLPHDIRQTVVDDTPRSLAPAPATPAKRGYRRG